MKIPFVDLKAQYYSIKEEIDKAISNVIQDSVFIGGKYAKIFEQDFANYVGVKNCVGVGNGTDALYIALRALGVGPGDEVITVANSFIATSEAITMTGARVVFVDCEEDLYTIDPTTVEKAITGKTKAIVPVHLYGNPADLVALKEIAKKHGLFVVEDAAQAHGAKLNGQRAGVLGDVACFSFYPGKNLGGYGDGGAIVTQNEELAVKCRMIANHGRKDKYDHEFEGINSRLDGLQAAILSVKLGHLEEWTEARREAARYYNSVLKDFPIALPLERVGARHVYHLYVIRVPDREKVQSYLKEMGVATGIHYPIALHNLKAYRYLGYSSDDFPNAADYSKEILSLPMFPNLTHAQIDYIAGLLRETL